MPKVRTKAATERAKRVFIRVRTFRIPPITSRSQLWAEAQGVGLFSPPARAPLPISEKNGDGEANHPSHLGPALLELPHVLEADQAAELVEGVELVLQRVARAFVLQHAVDAAPAPWRWRGSRWPGRWRSCSRAPPAASSGRIGVRPPSAMLASSGRSKLRPMLAISSSLSGLSMNRMSAPALAKASPRRSASSRPWLVRASVRATIRKSGEARLARGHLDLAHHLLDRARRAGRACARTSWGTPGPRSGCRRRRRAS